MRIGRAHGFTLIELLVALLVLSLLTLMAYRGLGVVMASRDHIEAESTKWRHAEAFFTRFERDVRLASPRRVRRAVRRGRSPSATLQMRRGRWPSWRSTVAPITYSKS